MKKYIIEIEMYIDEDWVREYVTSCPSSFYMVKAIKNAPKLNIISVKEKTDEEAI